MGTDIHLGVEHLDVTTGVWRRVLPPVAARDPWLVAQAAKEIGEEHRWYRDRAAVEWYDDRNYDVFAMLAGVRNGRAFAGCLTGEGFHPIAEPRGLPPDLGPELRARVDPAGDDDDNDIWLGDHSHSWLTVAELLAYDWDQRTRSCGIIPWAAWVTRQQAEEHGEPAEYCGGVSGPGICVYEEREARRLLFDNVIPAGRAYVRCWWEHAYREAAGRFLMVVLPALQAVDPAHPEHVRIVFGFDS